MVVTIVTEHVINIKLSKIKILVLQHITKLDKVLLTNLILHSAEDVVVNLQRQVGLMKVQHIAITAYLNNYNVILIHVVVHTIRLEL